MAERPQNFTPRAGSDSPGRVRRSLDAGVESAQRFGDGLEVAKRGASGGRLCVKLARGSGLSLSKEGLSVDPSVVGDRNLATMKAIRDPASASAADVHTTLMELLKELRRTGRVR